jgi:thiol-disulfide isomerase/thioredoxin
LWYGLPNGAPGTAPASLNRKLPSGRDGARRSKICRCQNSAGLDKTGIRVHSQSVRTLVVILFSLLAMASIAIAGETLPVLKAGTEVYSNVTVLSVSATDIYFTSSRGLANAKLKDLAPVLQKHFNFNPTNAVAVEQKQRNANAEYHFQVLKQPTPAVSTDGEPVPPPGAQIEPETGKQIWAKPLLNHPAPPLFVEKWLTPEPDGRGKFILIDFWQAASPPSRAVIPLLNAIQHDFAGKVEVISITRQSEEVVRQTNDVKIEHPLAVDTQARMEKSVGVTAAPHVILIDPHGVIRWEGYPLLNGYELTEKVVADIIGQYSNY